MAEVFLLVYFACSFLFIMALGLLQEPIQVGEAAVLPVHAKTEASSGEENPKAFWGLLAVSLIAIQALVSVLTLHGTASFPPAAVFVALTLLCHHSVIHRRSRFEGEVCSCAPFQCKDVSNHETWVVASLVAAAVSGLGV
jgi:hypothetical protein